ncbi:MAG: OmpA family protein [Nocardiopsaceae bacterium]|mgnify:CR=1 FL=1|nr:OmpA family protein [Nocardiopsaceae bacterium]
MSSIRRPSALLLSAALLLGLPYVLLRYVPWPAPDLSAASLRVHLGGLSLPPGLFTAALIVALWGLWGLFVVGFAIEAATRMRGRPGRFRPLGPLQIVAATAIGASLASPASAFADTASDEAVDQPARPDADAADGEAAPEEETSSKNDGSTDDAGDGEAPPQEPTPRKRVIAGFGIDEAKLSEEMKEDIDSTIRLIHDHGTEGEPVVVTGHTDASGDAQHNLELSKRRAQAVAEYIEAELGADGPVVEVFGAGAKELRGGEDAAAQRRVEIEYTVGERQSAAPDTDEEEPQSMVPGGLEDVEGMFAATDGEEETSPADDADEVVEMNGSGQYAAASSKVVMLEVPPGSAIATAALIGGFGGYAAARYRPGGAGSSPGGSPVGPMPPTGGGRRRSDVPDETAAEPPLEAAGGAQTGETAPVPTEPEVEPARPIDTAILRALTHAPGVGITGAGARPAARALLETALAADAPRPVHAVITGDDAEALLGSEGHALLMRAPASAVTVVGTPAEAVTAIGAEVRRRREDSAADTAEAAAGWASGADTEPTLVLLAVPEPEHEAELSGLLLDGQGMNVTAVLLGRWPLGGTCAIDADGLVSETSPPLNAIHGADWHGRDTEDFGALLRTLSVGGTEAGTESNEEASGSPHADAAPGEAESAAPEPAIDLSRPSVPAPVSDTGGFQAAPAGLSDQEDLIRATDTAKRHPRSADSGDVRPAGAASLPDAADRPEPPDTSPPAGGAPEPQPPLELRGPEPAKGVSHWTDPQRPVVYLRMFGAMRVRVAGQDVELHRRTGYEVAAYLAVHREGVRLETAIEEMWPDLGRHSGTRRFHDAATALRNAARDVLGDDAKRLIARTAGRYRLDPELVGVDVWEFDDVLAQVGPETGDADRVAYLEQAAALHRGRFAGDADYAWALPHAERLSRRAVEAAGGVVAGGIAPATESAPERALAHIDQALDLAPHDEELYQALMRLQIELGRSEAAQDTYLRCEKALKEMGTVPGRRTRELCDRAAGVFRIA